MKNYDNTYAKITEHNNGFSSPFVRMICCGLRSGIARTSEYHSPLRAPVNWMHHVHLH